MNILYLTHFNPWNPKYGAAFRSYGILRGLKKKHNLHIALVSKDGNEISDFLGGTEEFFNLHTLPANGTNGDTYDSVRALPSQRQEGNSRKQFLSLVEQIQPDVVWYFTKYALRLVGVPKGIPFVLDLDDVPWRKMLQMGLHQKGRQQILTMSKVLPSMWEDSWLARRADALVISNHEEKKWVEFGKPVTSIPNGFDFPNEILFHARPSRRVLFFGSLFYYPNLDGVKWLIDEVWQKVLAVIPDAHLDVVGLYNPDQIGLKNSPNITLHGFIDNLDNIIQESAFLVVPLRIASGTRIKILEAWSKGLPVVSTTIGAEGLGAEDGLNYLNGDTAEDFAAACIRLLQEPELGADLACHAYEHGKACFSWESIYPTLESVLEGINK